MYTWFATQLRPQTPGLWLLLSLLSLAILLLLWGALSARGRRIASLSRWVLIPYLGLISGGLSPRLLGLIDIDWRVSFSLGAGILFFILGATMLVRATTTFAPEIGQPAPSSSPENPVERIALASLFSTWLISGAEEFHWAFLRGALWEMLLMLPTPLANTAYVATWLATLFGGLELALLHISGRRRLFKLVLLVASAILFFFTRNFWLCWLLHTITWLILLPAEQKIAVVPAVESG